MTDVHHRRARGAPLEPAIVAILEALANRQAALDDAALARGDEPMIQPSSAGPSSRPTSG